ncbi:MAG TPA: hypothetical protein VKD72_19035 [Gemmataceae bacterium]|nr:hypothetical protein [Gemmataceae bacterium]
MLRSLIPERAQVILWADRGFDRTELARACQELDFRYPVRIKPEVRVEGPSYRGRLLDIPANN